MVGAEQRQVLRLAATLRQNQRAQRLGSPRFLVGGLGEASDPGFPATLSAGRLPAPDLHDDRCRCGGGEPLERIPGIARSWPAGPLSAASFEKGYRLRAAAGAAR